MFWYFENTQLRVSATWLFFFGCTWLILENCSISKEAFVLFFHFHFTSSLGRAFEAYPQKILPFNWCIFFHSCSHFCWHFKCQWQNAGLSEGMIWRAVRIWNKISCSNVLAALLLNWKKTIKCDFQIPGLLSWCGGNYNWPLPTLCRQVCRPFPWFVTFLIAISASAYRSFRPCLVHVNCQYFFSNGSFPK